MDRIGACGASDTGSTPVGRTKGRLIGDLPQEAGKDAGAVKRPGLENLGSRKAHASSNLAPSAGLFSQPHIFPIPFRPTQEGVYNFTMSILENKRTAVFSFERRVIDMLQPISAVIGCGGVEK